MSIPLLAFLLAGLVGGGGDEGEGCFHTIRCLELLFLSPSVTAACLELRAESCPVHSQTLSVIHANVWLYADMEGHLLPGLRHQHTLAILAALQNHSSRLTQLDVSLRCIILLANMYHTALTLLRVLRQSAPSCHSSPPRRSPRRSLTPDLRVSLLIFGTKCQISPTTMFAKTIHPLVAGICPNLLVSLPNPICSPSRGPM